jgi:hypothetical protein
LSRHLGDFEITVADCDFLRLPSGRQPRSVPLAMNSNAAEPALTDPANELEGAFADSAGAGRSLGSPRTSPRLARGSLRRLLAWAASLGPARAAAIRDSATALCSSRLLVWAAGVGTLLVFGFGPARKALNPAGVTRGFGWLGDLLAAPAARWDASWYLVIAHHGYLPGLGSLTSARAAFFPLYPLGLKTIAAVGPPPLIAGVLLSLLALGLALYGIHRLTTLELGRPGRRASARPGDGDAARLAVMATAFAPMAFYFSAVYPESLYLALSVGLFWCARHGRWGAAGALGALAAATRSVGVVLVLPALILYLYGPREDARAGVPSAPRPPEAERERVVRSRPLRRLAPRYPVRGDALWLGLVPGGLALYMAYFSISGGDALAPFHAQGEWGRHFAGPYLGVWDGVKAAFEGARQLLSFQTRHVYFPLAPGNPLVSAGHNLMLLAFLVAAVPAVVGVLRELPLAYGGYVVASLALPLSYPVPAQPLMSLPRFLVVLFPLTMWLGGWLADHPRVRAPALAGSAMLMALFVAEFATWHWVA